MVRISQQKQLRLHAKGARLSSPTTDPSTNTAFAFYNFVRHLSRLDYSQGQFSVSTLVDLSLPVLSFFPSAHAKDRKTLATDLKRISRSLKCPTDNHTETSPAFSLFLNAKQSSLRHCLIRYFFGKANIGSLTNVHNIEGRKLAIIDAATSVEYQRRQALFLQQSRGWDINNADSNQTQVAFNETELRNIRNLHECADVFNSEAGRKCFLLGQMMFPDCGPMRCQRTYSNAYRSGDALFTHVDGCYDHSAYRRLTCIVYVNPSWPIQNGAETFFYSSQTTGCHMFNVLDRPPQDWQNLANPAVNWNDGELAISVLPKPGRIAIFEQDMLHSGRSPQRHVLEPRLSTVYKMRCKINSKA